jgi:uncharacterized membrane protein YdjX (TVP38/TMEM64 family)
METVQKSATPRWRRFAPIAILTVAALIVWQSGLWRYASFPALQESLAQWREWADLHPWQAILAFSVLYALAVAVSVPGALWFTIAAGALFGWQTGTLVAWLGATTGATLIFVAVRSAAGQLWAGAAFGMRGQKLLDEVRRGLQARELIYLVLCRIVPLPFFLVNIAAALAGARLDRYVMATALGIVPGTLAYAILGASIGEALAAGGTVQTGIANVIGDLKIWVALGLVMGLTLIAHYADGWRKSMAASGTRRPPTQE